MILYDVESFMRHCSRKELSVKTLSSYEQTLRLFMMWLDEQGVEQTENIRHDHVAQYVDYILSRGKYTVCIKEESWGKNHPEKRPDYGRRVSSTTVNNYLRNMNAFFNWCVEEDIIRKNPVRRTDFIKVARQPQEFVSDSDFKKLLHGMDVSKFSEYRDSVIIRLLLDTGMRCRECLMIQVKDVDLQKRCIMLPAENTKGKKDRVVFYSDTMAKLLQRWMRYKDRYRDSDYLFCTNEGKMLAPTNFETNVRKYARRAGIKNVHPHVFRNNFAKRFLMSGGNIYTLSKILGHSSVVVTEQSYLDIDSDDLQKMYQGHSSLENLK